MSPKIVFMIPLVFFFNCASYWINLKNDFQDTVTIAYENPTYGAGVRIGPAPIGFVFSGNREDPKNLNFNGYGIRGGKLGEHHSRQLIFAVGGGETFYSENVKKDLEGNFKYLKKVPMLDTKRDNLKSYTVRYSSIWNDPPAERTKRKKDEVKRYIVNELSSKLNNPMLMSYIPPEDPKPYNYPKSYLYNIEVMAGIYSGIRVGVNISEILDLLTGILGYDLLGDNLLDKEEDNITVEETEEDSYQEESKEEKVEEQPESNTPEEEVP